MSTLAAVLCLTAPNGIKGAHSAAPTSPHRLAGRDAEDTRHSRGYVAAVRLNHALARTPMAGTGWALVTEGSRWNIHPAFIAAVAGLESSYGAHMCQRFNGWGLGSCPQRWHPPAFHSWRQGIAYFARWFRSRWHERIDMWAVGRTYCPPCGSGWGSAVASRMRILGFNPTTKWREGNV